MRPMRAADAAKMQGGSDLIEIARPGSRRLLAMRGQRGVRADVLAPTSAAIAITSTEQPKSSRLGLRALPYIARRGMTSFFLAREKRSFQRARSRTAAALRSAFWRFAAGVAALLTASLLCRKCESNQGQPKRGPS